MMSNKSWIVYTFLNVATWGIWGAFSAWPTTHYGYPEQWIYIIWSLTMLIPCYFSLHNQRLNLSGKAIFYGCLIGFTGAGGQLLLFKVLAMGAPAYLVFPIISVSPAITVLMSLLILKERVNKFGSIGVVLALISIIMFSISGGNEDKTSGLLWLLYSVIICFAWGIQAFFMKKASTQEINDSSLFGYMTITGILLAPVAWLMLADKGASYPVMAIASTACIQVLNAIGALCLVMALSRGKATIIAPCTNALAPVLTAIISLIIYQSMPGVWALIGIVLAISGSTIMVYSEEKNNAVKISIIQ
ncbi:TPA: DMT family transporter [Klebsiella pneumoniae]|nr:MULTISPECIES: DMT family transporter [Enterobacterales]HDT6511703.1 DMT family transporter [Klebsiella aerogenes]MCB8427507.1 DMT family transporter [Klebsiella pneumoniae]MCB8464474.1 DMT family transporter [Klebsiella pneumoniae]MEA4616248.1 EamA family transporter [Klebsiella pneumoniae]MEA4717312.1 EamA family transporter [Klebsiella pneumoniae]